ncbi:LPS export ABC transporter periplasmic protein LptC [Thiolapillus brandeum]|uniref:Lipopolysaccharide export system protein LptC n=1 Tax=Thiolapillus brandeum TaxID=1076588 RepID=A0A7U6GGT4_9GAMM|nr:LPS export ABC transporter periplasmic protein LptC [Thiolapillus brandeum]BAO43382.1 lipopolysaccharide export system protein LptC [Thiolapillus brandeum]
MRTWLLLLLLGVLGFTWWASRPEPSAISTTQTPGKDVQDYSLNGLALRQFDIQGQLSHRLLAEDMQHYRGSGLTRIQTPEYILYEQGSPVWTVNAARGELSSDQTLLKLFGKTTLEREADDMHPAMRLETADLRIYPHKEYAETDEPVTVTSEQNWIKSTGMQAWFKSPTRILFPAQARAHYVAQ